MRSSGCWRFAPSSAGDSSSFRSPNQAGRQLEAYRRTRATAVATCERVNARFQSDGYRPIVLLERHADVAEVYRMYRAADLCYVNSLDDGMNLVAKEFVHAREDEQGVLLLSEFAGASHQLTTALMVNPYAADQCARSLALALEMPVDEQARRMRHMRDVVSGTDSTWWGEQVLHDAITSRIYSARAERATA